MARGSTGGSGEAPSGSARSSGTAQSQRMDAAHASWIRVTMARGRETKSRCSPTLNTMSTSSEYEDLFMVRFSESLAGPHELKRELNRLNP